MSRLPQPVVASYCSICLSMTDISGRCVNGCQNPNPKPWYAATEAMRRAGLGCSKPGGAHVALRSELVVPLARLKP